MGRLYDVLTFDCYGTLIDWESGIGRWFEEAAAADGAEVAQSDALAAYAEIEPSVEARAYRSYREILAATALHVAKRLGWSLAPERASTLAESLPSWQPFPDTNPALERLATTGYSLGILSNVDDDLLSSTLRHFTVRFDLLITAQQVRSYKPALRHFHAARERIGTAAGSTRLRATSTTSSPPTPSASRSRGSTARGRPADRTSSPTWRSRPSAASRTGSTDSAHDLKRMDCRPVARLAPS